MRTCRESSGRERPERRTTLIGAAILFLVATPAPLWADGGEPSRASLLTEFNAICADLGEARNQLALGNLCDDEFADRILDLFVRADSLASIVGEGPFRDRRDLGSFALQKGLVYLIESLRENYVGIVGRNGIRFVEADQALKAAVAWRSGASDPAALK
jgi:hypothetical protein